MSCPILVEVIILSLYPPKRGRAYFADDPNMERLIAVIEDRLIQPEVEGASA